MGGGEGGAIRLDLKEVDVSEIGENLKKKNFKTGEWVITEIKQLLHVVCFMQSESSIWCMGEADRLVDNNATITIMATAATILLFLAIRSMFLIRFFRVLYKDYTIIVSYIMPNRNLFYCLFIGMSVLGVSFHTHRSHLSVQPVNRFSRFHTLCPCRIKTSLNIAGAPKK